MKKKTTITIDEGIYTIARAQMRDELFSDFSGYLEHLIREENRRRQGRANATAREVAQAALAETSSAAAASAHPPKASVPKQPVHYHSTRKPRVAKPAT